MLQSKCPGQDTRNWKPEDIFEHQCPNCQTPIEFWKTDAKRNCPNCKKPILNPKFNLGCALWCAYAEQCVGDLSGIFTERPEALRDRLEMEIRRYFIGESERLQRTLEYSKIASFLLEQEKDADAALLIAFILLRDTGYAFCKEHSTAGDLESCIREKSGELAVEIMERLRLPKPLQKKVTAMITDAEERSPDLNRELWEDIQRLGNFSLDGGESGAPGPENIMSCLNRESSRNYARSLKV